MQFNYFKNWFPHPSVALLLSSWEETKPKYLKLKAIHSGPSSTPRPTRIKLVTNVSVSRVWSILSAISVQRQQEGLEAPWAAWAGAQPAEWWKWPLLLSTQQTTSRIPCQFWEPKYKKGINNSEKFQWRMNSMLRAETLDFWGQTEAAGLCQPGEKTVLGRPEQALYLHGGHHEDGRRVFTGMHDRRMRDIGHKLNWKRFSLDIKRSFFTLRTGRQGKRLPKFSVTMREAWYFMWFPKAGLISEPPMGCSSPIFFKRRMRTECMLPTDWQRGWQ